MKDKRNKVLLIASEFPPLPGGIGNHAFNLAKHLTRNGFVVEVISDQRCKNASKELEFDKQQGFFIKRISLRKLRVFMYFNRLVSTCKLISKNEIIIASGKFSLWLAALFSVFFNKKFYAVVHGSEVNLTNAILKKCMNVSLQRFDAVIAVSKFTQSLISNLNLKRIYVIHNGFVKEEIPDINLNNELGFPSLVTVGSLTERKGQNNVIRFLPYLQKSYPKIQYHCIGTPVNETLYLNLAKQYKVENQLTIHGLLNEEEKQRILKSSTIFVMLSNQTNTGDVEGFGIALIEANSFGIPTIGSKNCGIEDAIDNYKSGILIDSNNLTEFENALKEILVNYDRYQKEAVAWSENFTWDKVIKEYIKVITD